MQSGSLSSPDRAGWVAGCQGERSPVPTCNREPFPAVKDRTRRPEESGFGARALESSRGRRYDLTLLPLPSAQLEDRTLLVGLAPPQGINPLSPPPTLKRVRRRLGVSKLEPSGASGSVA